MSDTAVLQPLDAARARRARLAERPFAARALALLAVAAAATAAALGAGALGTWQHVIVSGQSMEPTLSPGDLVLAQRQDAYAVGDVVVFRIPPGQVGAGVLVVHRIVGGSAAGGYRLRGDNRQVDDPWQPRPRDVLGKVEATVPNAGLVLAYARTVPGIAFITGFVVFLIALGPLGSSPKARSRPLDRLRPALARLRGGPRRAR